MGLQPMVQKNLTLNHFAFQQFQMDQIGQDETIAFNRGWDLSATRPFGTER